MPGALTTKFFQIHIAEQFIESLTEPANNIYYMFVGKSLPWPNDASPPDPENTVSNLSYNAYENMLFGKILTSADTSLMAPRYNWVANTVFDFYDDTVDLSSKKFFVTVNANTSYHVFKCLHNANGAPSMVAPDYGATSPEDEFYQTSDGYQWKYMYSIDSSTFNRFATPDFIPYTPNANVSANAIVGAIDTILVENAGTRFNSYANGYFVSVNVNGDPLIHTIEAGSSSNTDFYKNSSVKIVSGRGAGQQRKITEYIVSGGQKNIVIDTAWVDIPDNTSKYEITPNVEIEGDGTGAQARAIINPSSNTVQYVEITSRGSGYTWARATVQANTGFVSANSVIANNAILRVIIGPAEGHGGNIPYELGMNKVGISTSFANTELGTIPATNKFRTIGLIRDPLFRDVDLTLTDVVGTFVDGETIISLDTSATAKVTNYNESGTILSVSESRGIFSANDDIKGLTSNSVAKIANTTISGKLKNFNTFDQRYRFDITYNSNTTFTENTLVTQDASTANGYVHEANAIFVALTNTKGVFNTTDIDNPNYLTDDSGAVANVEAIYAPDIIEASGKILYIENTQPIQRSNTSTETVKLVIGFS